MHRDKLEKLVSERSDPCVTISMKTHRTTSNKRNDIIELQKLIREAHELVAGKFGQHAVSNLLEKIEHLEDEIDLNYSLNSLHIFLSETTKEIVKTPWPILKNTVSVSQIFAIKPMIRELNQHEEYLLLVLSETEVRLLQAINNTISGKIKSDDFPFVKNPYFLARPDKLSDVRQYGNPVHEFFRQIDKALVVIYNNTYMPVVVICTEIIWNQLLQVTDNPSIYLGNINLNFKTKANHSLISEAWKIVIKIQEDARALAIKEMKEAAAYGKVVTDLLDIYLAVKAGRGDLLITQDDYNQSILPGVIDYTTRDVAWEVIRKNGRAIFTNQEEFKSIGNIALKVRY